jgi:AcrR family transcriptional regulator
MPKKTFVNLSIEKQKRVLNAAVKEFSRVSLREASIANIIVDAKIPRGSFYQYFEDKDDIFYYVLNFYAQSIKKHLIKLLMDNKGDIIVTFINLYKYVIDFINDKQKKVYFKNIFLNMNYKLERMFTPNLEDDLNNVINLIDIDKLNINNKIQLIYILDIIEAVTMRNIVQSYKRNVSKEKNVEIYIKEMKLIKEGVYKKQGY